MKLPETLKVGPYDYAVQLVEGLKAEADNRALYGDWESSPPRIRIRADETDARILATFLHEAIHVLDEYMLIGLTEKQTTRLGAGLAALLRDNHLLADTVAGPDEPPAVQELHDG